MKNMLLKMVDQLAFELRSKDRLSSTVTVKLRHADFNTYTKQRRIPYTANERILSRHIMELFDSLNERRQLIRLIGVKFSGLVNGNYQINIFDDTAKEISLMERKDHIRKRFGSDKILRAAYLDDKTRMSDRSKKDYKGF